MELISMTDYVLKSIGEFNSYESEENLKAIINYANFLKQPIKLGMFIPCDDNDVPLEITDEMKHPDYIELDFEYLSKESQQYEKAKERVLFKGFEIKEFNGSSLSVTKVLSFNDVFCGFWFDGDLKKWYLSAGLFTVGDLVKCGLELTDSAIKQLNL